VPIITIVRRDDEPPELDSPAANWGRRWLERGVTAEILPRSETLECEEQRRGRRQSRRGGVVVDGGGRGVEEQRRRSRQREETARRQSRRLWAWSVLCLGEMFVSLFGVTNAFTGQTLFRPYPI